MLYSKSIEGLYERDVRKSKIEKLYAKRRTRGYIPSSNFRTATPRERLSMPAVAMAVFSESVSCSTVNQLKVYMSAMFENRRSKNSTPSRRTYAYIPSNFRTATPRERLSMPAVAVAVSSESVSCSTVNQLKVYMSAMFENRRSKNSTPSRRTCGTTFNFRTATPRERLSMPAVAIAVSSESVSCSTVDQLKVYMSAMFENRRSKNSTPSRRTRGVPSNFRTATPRERLPMPAVAVAVSSESVSCSTVNQFKVYMSAMFENRRSKNSTPSRRTRGIPSNFRTATPTERLPMPAVAVAVFSESVSCSTVDQLKVYMSAMFENRRSKNSTPSRRPRGYIPSSNFRTATPRERLPMPAVAVAVSSESVSCSTVNQLKVYMSAMFENRKSKNSTPSRRTRGYLNFRTATPRERLSTPAVAMAVSSESVSCSTVNQFKVYMSAMFENRKSKNSTPSRRTRGYPISERRRRENVCRCPLSPWQCPPSLYRALQ